MSRAHDNFSGAFHIVSISHLEGLINVNNLIKSLRILYMQHPLLKAIINNTSYKPSFEIDQSRHKFENIPIVAQLRKNDSHWETVLNLELKTPLQITESLWRVIILHEPGAEQSKCELIFSFHHAISDVISIAYFIKDMLTHYSNLQNLKLNEKKISEFFPYYHPQNVFLQRILHGNNI